MRAGAPLFAAAAIDDTKLCTKGQRDNPAIYLGARTFRHFRRVAVRFRYAI